MKRCTQCEQPNDSDFKTCSACREKNARWRASNPAYMQDWKKNNPEYFRNRREKIGPVRGASSSLKKKYGLTPDDFLKISEKQGDVCAICGSPPRGGNAMEKRLHVDHCHRTGKVRGLLCNHCNNGLGCFKDNKRSLQRAIWYLNERG